MAHTFSSLFCVSAVSLSLFAGCGNVTEEKEVIVTPGMLRSTTRQAAHPIEPLLLHRWSARAFSGEPVTDQELNQLFEAARWAPSSYNNQPWRFIYAKRDTPAWDSIFNLMVDFNKSWAHNAGALVVIVSADKTEKGQPIRTHSFDTGAAWQNVGLQAASMGLVAHGMSGFDYARAREVLHVPEGYTVEAMFAIGHPGKVEDLPQQLQANEVASSNRKSVDAFAYEGSFPHAQAHE